MSGWHLSDPPSPDTKLMEWTAGLDLWAAGYQMDRDMKLGILYPESLSSQYSFTKWQRDYFLQTKVSDSLRVVPCTSQL